MFIVSSCYYTPYYNNYKKSFPKIILLQFSAETSVKLIPKIIGGPYPSLPEHFSPELCKLLSDIFNKDPQSRPTVQEILRCPMMISCLSEKV